jgi:uncharacterized peroxidase-related enzyme
MVLPDSSAFAEAPILGTLHARGPLNTRRTIMARLTSVTLTRDRSAPERPSLPPECNFLHLLANSPAAYDAYAACAAALAQGQLTARQRELLALTVGEINGARYCLSAHYAMARNLGLEDAEIRAARRASSSDAQTHAILRFTQAVAIQRGEVSDADFQSLRKAGFSDSLIVELVLHIALNIFTNYFNSVARTDVDFPLLKPGADSPISSLDQHRIQTEHPRLDGMQ